MGLPDEAGLKPQAMPSHHQHQKDAGQAPHQQENRESAIHLGSFTV
jgi:hypothetical protein